MKYRHYTVDNDLNKSDKKYVMVIILIIGITAFIGMLILIYRTSKRIDNADYVLIESVCSDVELSKITSTQSTESAVSGLEAYESTVSYHFGKNVSQPVGEMINLNTATFEQLKTLNGIGDSRAAAIIEYREKHGGFKNIEQLKNIPCIGEKLFEGIRSRITV